MQRSSEKQDVIVVAIDMNVKDVRIDEFALLESEKQFEVLCDKIKFICEQLKQTHQSSRWIIAWRDYGITGIGLDQKTVTPEFKRLYKKMLQEFVKQYPNLTIVAGTIAIEKKGKIEKLDRIQRSYDRLGDYIAEERETVGSLKQAQEFDQHLQELQTIRELAHEKHPEFKIIRNTCYVFTSEEIGNEKQVAAVRKHSKTTPQGDSSVTLYEGMRVFHPGDWNSRKPIIDIGGGYKIATEICREHDFSVARKEAEKHKVARSDILLHFVMSYSIMLNPKNFYGAYVLQLDSVNKPRLIIADPVAAKDTNVTMYQLNLLDQQNTLIGPVAPLQELFADRIIKEFEAILKVTRSEDKRQVLSRILENFKDSAQAFVADPMYSALEEGLTNRENQALLCQEQKRNIVSTFFSAISGEPTGSDMKKWIGKILNLVAEEKKNNPIFQAYIPKKDAPLLKG